jgi:hypothetical protein
MYDQLIAQANQELNASVRIGAVVFDSEQFIWPGTAWLHSISRIIVLIVQSRLQHKNPARV